MYNKFKFNCSETKWELNFHGWVWVGVGLPEIKANSSQFQVKLPTGAELGNM